jgi:hypothetical protein
VGQIRSRQIPAETGQWMAGSEHDDDVEERWHAGRLDAALP